MKRHNFRPNFVDHCQMLILVRPFYSTSEQDFNFLMTKLTKFQYARVQSTDRVIKIKFQRLMSREHIEWGRLQTHRKPIGLVGLARLSADNTQHQTDIEKVENRYEHIKSQYDAVLFDSRCFVVEPKETQTQIKTKQDFFLVKDGDLESTPEFVNFVNEFISSVFVVLESKRIEKGNEKLEKMELPVSPIEQEQVVSEFESRNMKRKCLGRNRKLLADLCLLSGLYHDALYHYFNSAEHLRSVSDYLWMGAALEGLCATSIIMTKIGFPDEKSPLVVQNSNIDNGTQGDLNIEEEKAKNCMPLTDDEIINKLSEVLGCYKRYSTGPVQMEAHLKFMKILITMKRTLETCQVMQSFLSLPWTNSDSEKVELCQVIASIYEQMNLKRKAAFFRRRISMHCLSQHNVNEPALRYAAAALLKTTSGYKLDLENCFRPESGGDTEGWSSLQLRILLDILSISTRLGDTMNCIRLLCFILEAYHLLLSEEKKMELINRLEDCSTQAEEMLRKQPKSTTATRVRMIRSLPIVRDFKPRKLARHLQPMQQANTPEQGPFIFSSLSFRPKSAKVPEVIRWVCGDVVEVGMTVDNPMPAEMKVNSMILVTEGIEFEEFPATLALPAESGSFPFMLLGIPSQPGLLTIKGYKVDVFGIENTVLLDTPISVQVTPVLPLLQLSSSLPVIAQLTHANPDNEDYQTLFTSTSLYRGHSCTATITLENVGKIAITKINVTLKKEREKTIVFDENALKRQLPLEPGKSVDMNILVLGSQAWKMQPTAVCIRPCMTFSYSGDDVENVEYTRDISMVVDVKVMPSLHLENFDIYELERHPTCCCLCFDVKNLMSVDVNVKTIVTETEEVTLRDGCPREAEVEIPAKGSSRLGVHFPRCLLTLPENRRRETIENVYTRAVKDSVALEWRLSQSEYSGVSYLSALQLTADMVHMLKPKHLEINVTADHQKLKEKEIFQTPKCKMIHIHAQLTNAHEMDLQDLVLSIHPYQQDRDDVIFSRPLVTWCGTLTKNIRKLSPGESFEHSCGLLFMFTGQYLVDVTCTVDKQKMPDASRARTHAIANDDSAGFDTVDSGDIQVIVDGAVKTIVSIEFEEISTNQICTDESRDSNKPTVQILHKPTADHWERNFAVSVT